MHPYATDSVERKIVPLYLVGVSIAAAFVLHAISQGVVPWWVEVPSVPGFYGLFHLAFEKWLWRMPILSTVGLVKIPNLNGKWIGYVLSSFDEHATKQDATLEIHQRWTGISICFQTGRSRSRSLLAGITTENPTAGSLTYEYINEPKSDAVATMNIHRGLARLDLSTLDDRWVLEGEYYSGRGRQNFGTVHFERPVKSL